MFPSHDLYALKIYQSTSDNFGDGVRVYYDNGNTAFVHRFLNTTSIVELKGDGGNNSGIYMLSSATGGGTLNIRDNSGNYTLSASSGNVGIGTNTPSSTLHIIDGTSGDTVLQVDGTNGTLFSVVDDLSDSLMSVNDAAGLPVLEVFADNHVVAGRYGQNDFYIDTGGNINL